MLRSIQTRREIKLFDKISCLYMEKKHSNRLGWWSTVYAKYKRKEKTQKCLYAQLLWSWDLQLRDSFKKSNENICNIFCKNCITFWDEECLCSHKHRAGEKVKILLTGYSNFSCSSEIRITSCFLCQHRTQN